MSRRPVGYVIADRHKGTDRPFAVVDPPIYDTAADAEINARRFDNCCGGTCLNAKYEHRAFALVPIKRRWRWFA